LLLSHLQCAARLRCAFHSCLCRVNAVVFTSGSCRCDLGCHLVIALARGSPACSHQHVSLQCLLLCIDGRFLLSGDASGHIILWDILSLHGLCTSPVLTRIGSRSCSCYLNWTADHVFAWIWLLSRVACTQGFNHRNSVRPRRRCSDRVRGSSCKGKRLIDLHVLQSIRCR